MDPLACELLHHILQYIDDPLDLFRICSLCQYWQFTIMHDEYFLNQWFSRSLKSSKEPHRTRFASYSDHCLRTSPPCIMDESIFPIHLRSTPHDVLPWAAAKYSCDYERLSQHVYSLSLFQSSHSFSFWFFLPQQFDLNIQIGNSYVDGVNIVLSSDVKYYVDQQKQTSIADRWIHIALNKTVSQRHYDVWIDGKHLPSLIQYYLYFSKTEQDESYINMVSFRKSGNHPLELSERPRIADLNALKRCLSRDEIRAIHQQQTSIEQIKVGSYICNNEIYDTEIN